MFYTDMVDNITAKHSTNGIHHAQIDQHHDGRLVVWHWKRRRPDGPLIMIGWTLAVSDTDLELAIIEMNRLTATPLDEYEADLNYNWVR